jgi:hypothetical protein
MRCFPVLMTVAMMQGNHVNDVFSASQELVVRECVYNETPGIESPNRDFRSILIVPDPLSTLYREQPKAVLALLLKIVDGSSPKDSVLAAGYAMSLLDDPSAGVVCVEHFDKATYDKVDEDWKTTPRKHWMRKIAAKMQDDLPRP